jgi:type I restriction enzyme S subunit
MKEGWEYKKLGEVCDFEGGSQPPKSEWINHPQEGYMRMLQIRDFTKSRNAEIEYVKITKKLRICKADDILIGRYGASVGKILTGLAGAYNVAIIKSIPNEEIISKDFIRRYFESSLFQSILFKVCTSRAAQAGFSKDDIKDELIPIPPLPEQQSIVKYLDSAFAKIDAMKANAEKALNEAKALFQASLKEMLEPKEGWEEKKLGEIATDMYRGSGVKRDQVTEEGISCVRYGEIYTKYNYHFNVCHSHTLEEYVKSPKYFEHGDILFAITGESVEEIGKNIAYTGNEKCIAGGDIVVMKHNYEPRYISYALSTPSSVKQKGIGKTKLKVVHTNIPSLKEIIIPIAPQDEQIKIANTLDSLKSKVDKLQANYDKISQECDALKQSILRQVFE